MPLPSAVLQPTRRPRVVFEMSVTRASTKRLRAWTAGAAFAALALAAPDARAWYFPEHAVFADEGAMQLPPDVRAILRSAIVAANRDEGLGLCESLDVPFEKLAKPTPLTTKMIRVSSSVDCVPYATLGALAGDHSSNAGELRDVLRSKKGTELVSAAAFEWRRFQASLERLPNTSFERMSFVHSLDVAFYFVDPGYEKRAQGTRAHFSDSGSPIASVVRAAERGDVDNALGQLLAHHVRSLQLAARGELAEALLEHGFALHFIEDAFAAGHLIGTSWSVPNDAQRRRHDYYNARGLAVGRAMNVVPCTSLGIGALEMTGLPPCWATTGDGYLSATSDASDRLHVSRAVAKVQLQLALAIDPDRVKTLVDTTGEGQALALAQLVEPTPWWTIRADQRHRLRASAERARRLVHGAAAAVEALSRTTITPQIVVGSTIPRALFDAGMLDTALDPCLPRERLAPTLLDDDGEAACEAPLALALGTPGTSLVRPLLAEWPAPQSDVRTLRGESKEDLGFTIQLLASASVGLAIPFSDPVQFYMPGVGVSGGFAYRWGTYLPGRVNRPLAEVNVGVTAALQYDAFGHAGGSPQVTFFHQELRWPIFYELLASYTLPFNLDSAPHAGKLVLLSGARVHQVLDGVPKFYGIELEMAALALTRGEGSYPLYAPGPELRLYMGAADTSSVQPGIGQPWAMTIGVLLTGGYATFL